MAFQSTVPPSVVAKLAKSAEGGEEGEDGEPTNRREDYKKLKELEEMRKAGTAPAMKDEEGKDINPHIPQYIMQAPWYFGTTQATLRHQRAQEEKQKAFAKPGEWYTRGVKEGPVATKYRKGACENCGAMTHIKRDCLERPRKIGARFTGTDIAPDELLHSEFSMDFDGKRDRWNGYNLDKHKQIVHEFQKIEEAKKQLKADTLDKQAEEQEGVDDEDKYAEEMDMPGQKFETKQRITVRNLRIREDTAKYLYNLNVDSAYYDPKTRSMRENPFESTGKDIQDIPYGGDNFVRMSGDAMGIAKRQMFAWDAYEKGADIHLQADPTKLEMLANEFKQRKEEFKTNVKESILDKYGGAEHLQAPPKQLLLAQTEDYVEYSRHGTVIKGQEKAAVKSRYEEDIYLNNHTNVWGSYWKDGKWGFKCCSSLIKESYCTGEAGKDAAQNSIPGIDETPSTSERLRIAPSDINQSDSEEEIIDEPMDEEQELKAAIARLKQRREEKRAKRKDKKRKKNKKKKKRKESSSSSSSSSESEDEEAAKEKRIREAIRREEARVGDVDQMLTLDERKRKYNSMYDDVEPTEDDMEAFRRKQKRFEDPMANFT